MAIGVLDSWVFFVLRSRFRSGKEGRSWCQVGKVKDKSPVAKSCGQSGQTSFVSPFAIPNAHGGFNFGTVGSSTSHLLDVA
ncbi:hypothetical protein NC651_038384 [Populus alba x Populus x berolinensis]|nr:hypothetical protein NC651_038384 [Populus alba x Populus x berolinensis]